LLLSLGAVAMSPVTRVVELLEGLSKQIDTEAKAEEDLYETFVCWAKSIIGQKTRSNAAATARIEELETYIKDLEAGRIELTTERVDLEKEIETLKGELEVATQLREKESEDFATAKDEMEKAIAALSAAIEVLKEATSDHKEGVLLALRGSSSAGASERSRQAQELHLAVNLGQRMLTHGDAVFLQRLLTGEVPTADWKKLNRKATFKMDYKARSFKIQGVLAKMLETFSENLEDATAKENEAIALFNKLKKAKGAELKAAEDALQKMAKENGARGLSKDQAQTEVDELKAQVANDTKYIGQVEEALATKKKEWKARKELRAGELAAISKAIAVLHSDDARDTFKKSFASQGYLFLQEGASRAALRRRSAAVGAIRDAEAASSDRRMSSLATCVERSAAQGHFDEVIAAIDKMLEMLKAEEATDLETKEACEKDRAADTRDAIKASRAMDEHTEAIVELESKIEELTKLIAEKEATVVEIEQQLKEAAEDRKKENDEYIKAKKLDEDAALLVEQAKQVLEQFYTENDLMLVQKHKQAPFQSLAGEAPPPPPPTWEGGYAGKTNESGGIVAILSMIKEDILKDIAKADKEEADAQALYDKTKTALETEKTDLKAEILTAEGEKGDAEGDVEDNKEGRSTKRGELEIVMKKIKDAEPGCAFFQINYPLRVRNRQVEIDGLTKAKAILSGGKFDGLPDPDREIKPGDALLQQKLRAVAGQLRVRAIA